MTMELIEVGELFVGSATGDGEIEGIGKISLEKENIPSNEVIPFPENQYSYHSRDRRASQ